MRSSARLLILLLLVLTAVPAGAQAPGGPVTITYNNFARCGRIVLRRANRLNPFQYTQLTPRNNGIYLLFAISGIRNDSLRPFTFRPERLFVPTGNESWNVATNLGDPLPPQSVSVPAGGAQNYTGWVVMEYSRPGYTSRQLLRNFETHVNAFTSLRYRTVAGESPVLIFSTRRSALTVREECTGIDLRDRWQRLY